MAFDALFAVFFPHSGHIRTAHRGVA